MTPASAARPPGLDAPKPPATAGPTGRRGLWTLALLGTALRLGLVWSGWCDNRVVADDAFYYFNIARHVAAGHGATFDGLAATNGFHPLWLLLLTPVFALTGALRAGSWVGVHLALSLCALLDVASGALLWRLLRRLGSPRGAHWATAVWFLSPVTVLLSLRGMESALTVTLFAVWLWVVAWAFEDGAPDVRRGALVGIVTGLAFLARTDNGPLLGLSLALITLGSGFANRGVWRRSLGFFVAAGVTALAIALPWFVWNLTTFGTPWQVSGAAKLANPQIFGHVPAGLGHRLRYLGAFVWVPAYFAAGESMRHRAAFTLFAWAGWLVLAAHLPFFVLALVRSRATVLRPLALGLLGYLAAHAVVYALVLRTYVVWYATVPIFILVFLAGGVAAGELLERLRAPWRAALGVVAAAAGIAILAQYFTATKIVPRGEEWVVRPILTKIATRAPGARTVGVFNAGAAGYFAPEIGPFTVVNLDGLVNNPAVEAWREGRYYEYLDRNVDVVINDADGTLNFLLGPGNRPRFDARYPRWSPGSLVCGPRLQAPVR
jgi:hypothetical protein